MAFNFPGPYQVIIEYTVDGLTHNLALNCDVVGDPAPGTVMSSIDVVTRGGGSDTIITAVEDLVTILKQWYTAADTFVKFDLWKYTPYSFDKLWISTHSLAISGTSGSSTVKAGELIFTARTQEGGLWKLTLEESVVGTFEKTAWGAVGGTAATLLALVEGTDNWMLARDTSYPIAGMNYLHGQNERIFRKRYR